MLDRSQRLALGLPILAEPERWLRAGLPGRIAIGEGPVAYFRGWGSDFQVYTESKRGSGGMPGTRKQPNANIGRERKPITL
jgi:hypothetical protein